MTMIIATDRNPTIVATHRNPTIVAPQRKTAMIVIVASNKSRQH
jgi:hypothetical protein